MKSKAYKIFVVEDQVVNQMLVENLLVDKGYYVRIFPKATEALSAILVSKPDLIVLDLMMPEMDGFAFLEQLRAFTQIPVLVVTARMDVESMNRAVKLGANDYMMKPFHTQDFTNKVNRLLQVL